MFKVPDWGNDIPKSNVDVSKLFSNKSKNKSPKKASSKPKNNESKNNKGKKQKNFNGIGKPKNKFVKKVNGHVKLNTDDHISNRILKRNQKITAGVKSNETSPVKNAKQSTQKKISHANSIKEKRNDVNDTMNSKILKRKEKFKSKTNELKPENDNNSKVHSKDSKSAICKNIAKKRLNNGTIKNATEGHDVNTKLKSKILKRKQKLKSKTNEPKVENDKDNKSKVIHSNDSKNTKIKDIAKKRLNNGSINNASAENSIDIQSYNSDELDKVLVNAKRKKLNDKIKNDDKEDVLFGNKFIENGEELTTPLSKVDKIQIKKDKIKEVLKKDSNRNVIKTSGGKLRMRMLERLKAAQFRYLNEQLYTSSGSESQELFKSDPAAFQVYHEGYQQQVKKWPINPLDIIVKRIAKMPKTHIIADMGCGEAALSKRVSQRVHSFDLVARSPAVLACDMARTPLLAASVDIVVYCLALMGTDLTRYLLEANRVLKIGGHLLIAEVESRFDNPETFSSDVQRLGFSLKNLDRSHKVFIFMEFNKVRDAPSKKNKLPELSLKPCLYKRR